MKQLIDYFPREVHPHPRVSQVTALEFLGKHDQATLEAPPGSGKTDIAITYLRAGVAEGEERLFYITPNKAQVDQAAAQFPKDLKAVYGRGEYDCLYPDYGPDNPFKANEVPCHLLADCPHRVNQDTGETFEPGAEKCPYYQAKYEAKHCKKPVVGTVHFFLFTHLFSKEFLPPQRLVIDEVHNLAEIFRSALTYEITDYHLYRSIDLLLEIGATEEARQLERFTKRMIALAGRRKPRSKVLLDDKELIELINLLAEVNEKGLKSKVSEAIRAGKIDKLEKRDVLKKLETLMYDLHRYILSLEYSVFTEKRKALSYTFAYYQEELADKQKVQYRLVICSYYVAPLIKKLLAPHTLAMSGTIGDDPKYLAYETGIESPFLSLPSEFPSTNAMFCVPSDARDLRFKERSRQDLNKSIRDMIRGAFRLAQKGHRSMLVLQSNEERQKCETFAAEMGLNAVNYGNGTSAREALRKFKGGEGQALIGTASHYGEGVDLPKGLCEAIFMLRPGFPSPFDPRAQYEEKRFPGGYVYGLRKWRAGIQAVQTGSRNRRSKKDKGVTVYMSSQFGNIVYNALPEALREAYARPRGKTLEECLKMAEELLA